MVTLGQVRARRGRSRGRERQKWREADRSGLFICGKIEGKAAVQKHLHPALSGGLRLDGRRWLANLYRPFFICIFDMLKKEME